MSSSPSQHAPVPRLQSTRAAVGPGPSSGARVATGTQPTSPPQPVQCEADLPVYKRYLMSRNSPWRDDTPLSLPPPSRASAAAVKNLTSRVAMAATRGDATSVPANRTDSRLAGKNNGIRVLNVSRVSSDGPLSPPRAAVQEDHHHQQQQRYQLRQAADRSKNSTSLTALASSSSYAADSVAAAAPPMSHTADRIADKGRSTPPRPRQQQQQQQQQQASGAPALARPRPPPPPQPPSTSLSTGASPESPEPKNPFQDASATREPSLGPPSVAISTIATTHPTHEPRPLPLFEFPATARVEVAAENDDDFDIVRPPAPHSRLSSPSASVPPPPPPPPPVGSQQRWASTLASGGLRVGRNSPVLRRNSSLSTASEDGGRRGSVCSNLGGALGPSYLATSRECGGASTRPRHSPLRASSPLRGSASRGTSASAPAMWLPNAKDSDAQGRREGRTAPAALRTSWLLSSPPAPGTYKLLDDDFYERQRGRHSYMARSKPGSVSVADGDDALLALQRKVELEKARVQLEMQLRLGQRLHA